MPSRFMSVAVALAVPLLLAACEQEAQEEAQVGQAEEPAPTAEGEQAQQGRQRPETGRAAEPAPASDPAQAGGAGPGETEAAGAADPYAGGQTAESGSERPPAGAGDSQEQQAPTPSGEPVVVVPPAEEGAGDNQEQAAQAPGEPAPHAAGVASVAAYVGRWAVEPRMCEDGFWTFTNLRLQSPDNLDCDIQDTEERQDGVTLTVACTNEAQPLAERDPQEMALEFPNMPQTDTMVVSGGPLSGELTLTRCELGQQPATAPALPPQNR